MVTKTQLINGLAAFVTTEMLPAMKGWHVWAAALIINLAKAGAGDMVDVYLSHPLASALGVVSEDGLIDIDKVYQAFAEEKGLKPFDIDLPLGLGTFTIKPANVETLRDCILHAEE